MNLFKTALVATALAATNAPAFAADSITIGTNNWAENIAVSHMWQLLLAEKDIEVELNEISKPILFSGLAEGDVDLFLEVWIPSDQDYVDRYDGRVTLHDTWYDNARDTLVVPSYVEGVDSVADLAERSEDFTYQGQPTIFGIGPGATISDEAEAAIEHYMPDYRQLGSSESAMLTQLRAAIDEREPIAVTLWQPHWAFAEWNLKILEDPAGVFAANQQIKWVSHSGFAEEAPEVAAMLNAWHMEPEQLAELMLVIEEDGDPSDGAADWIADNRELVDEWLAAGTD